MRNFSLALLASTIEAAEFFTGFDLDFDSLLKIPDVHQDASVHSKEAQNEPLKFEEFAPVELETPKLDDSYITGNFKPE